MIGLMTAAFIILCNLYSRYVRYTNVSSHAIFLFPATAKTTITERSRVSCITRKVRFVIIKCVYLLALSSAFSAISGESKADTVEDFNKCIERNSKESVSYLTVRNFCISNHQKPIVVPLEGKADFKKTDCDVFRDRESGSYTTECDIVFDGHIRNSSTDYVVTGYTIVIEYTVRKHSMSIDSLLDEIEGDKNFAEELAEAFEGSEKIPVDITASQDFSNSWIEPGQLEKFSVKNEKIKNTVTKLDELITFSWSIRDAKGLEIQFE